MKNLTNRADLVYDTVYAKMSHQIYNQVLHQVWKPIMKKYSQNPLGVPVLMQVNPLYKIKSEIQTVCYRKTLLP